MQETHFGEKAETIPIFEDDLCYSSHLYYQNIKGTLYLLALSY